MSVERIQLLHEDYIRLTDRFKSLWTFHQFLRGVYKTFFSSEPGYALDFNALYEEVKSVAGGINTMSADALALRLKEMVAKLDTVARELRQVDRKVSPSFVRRFFDRVRPQDEKIAFYLLRFYFSQADIDEDVVDKVDFLATVAATGRPDPEAAASRPRPAVQRLFETITASSVWPRMESGMTPTIVRAFDELASDMAQAREFEQLMTDKLLNNARTMKRRVANGLANPDILTAVAWCNLTTRAVFHRLYEREEKRLEDASGRITDLERELHRGGEEGPAADEFRKFHETRLRFDRQAMDRNLRAQHVLELKRAIGEVLDKFDISGLQAGDIDEALELVEEIDSDAQDEAFWKPCIDRVLASVDLYDGGRGPLRPELTGLVHLKLESWELAASRKAVASGSAAGGSEIERTILRAAALRSQAESETAALADAGGAPAAPELLRAARATLVRAPALEAALDELAGEAQGEDVRALTRTRHRLRQSASELWLALDHAEAHRTHVL